MYNLVSIAILTCVSECKHKFSDWTRKHAIGAHVSEGKGLKHITMAMQPLLTQHEQCSFVDVGAASYGDSNSEDYSDSLIFLTHTTTCKGFAFEIIPEEAEKLRVMSQKFQNRLTVLNMGVANVSGTMFVHHPEGKQSHNTYTLKNDRHLKHPSKTSIKVVSLDEFHKTHMDSAHINYIKVDSEGYDPVIARGMTNLLSTKSVDVISFEYSIGWDKKFELLTRQLNMHTDRRKGQQALHIIGELRQSLRGLQTYISSFGYEVFLIVGNTQTFSDFKQDVAIIPIYGAIWDDWYELCLHTCQYNHCWHCWTDILVLNPQAEFARSLKSHLILTEMEQCYDVERMKTTC